MESAVQKLSTAPAIRLGITDRGVIRPGLHADITVFDPDTIIDHETYQNPHAFPGGVEYVVVDGRIVVEEGAQSDLWPGKVLGLCCA